MHTHTHDTHLLARAQYVAYDASLQYICLIFSLPSASPFTPGLTSLPPTLSLCVSSLYSHSILPLLARSFSPALSYLAGTTLGNAGIELIVSSPLTRALHTATLAHGHARVCMYAL